MVTPSLEASWISRVDSTAEQLAGQLGPLADELRSRPVPAPRDGTREGARESAEV